MTSTTRRRLLASVAGLAAVNLAGCAGENGDDGPPTGTKTPSGTPSSSETRTGHPATTTAPDRTDDAPTATETTTEPSTLTDELDLREANVVAVAFERVGDEYRFDVTLIHDDDGEDGFADWWQVETLDGEQVGRRELLHAHGTREFTRSRTVEIPSGTTCVVVRGHDQTHGYGGQAMVVHLDTGETTAVRQGSDPQSFAAFDC